MSSHPHPPRPQGRHTVAHWRDVAARTQDPALRRDLDALLGPDAANMARAGIRQPGQGAGDEE